MSTKSLRATSGPSWQHRRVQALEFDAGISSGEPPIDVVLVDIAVVPPRADFVDECVSVRNAAVQALASQHAQLRLGHVEPAPMLGRVVNLQLIRQPLGFGRWERLIQRAVEPVNQIKPKMMARSTAPRTVMCSAS